MTDIKVDDQSSEPTGVGTSTDMGTTSEPKSMDITKEGVSASVSASSSDHMASSPSASPEVASNQSPSMNEQPVGGGSTTPGPEDPLKNMTNSPASIGKVKAFQPKSHKTNFLRLFIEILLVIAIGLLVYELKILTNDKNTLTNQVNSLTSAASSVQTEHNAVISSVAKQIPSLSGQTPSITTLSSSDLKGQTSSFYTNAKTGDDLLIYVSSNEAVIYNPTTAKVVINAPISFTVASATSSTSTTTK